MPPGMFRPGSARTVLVSEVHRHSATATMALMALFVLWKDNTTPGKYWLRRLTS